MSECGAVSPQRLFFPPRFRLRRAGNHLHNVFMRLERAGAVEVGTSDGTAKAGDLARFDESC